MIRIPTAATDQDLGSKIIIGDQCFGSGFAWISIVGDLDPDPEGIKAEMKPLGTRRRDWPRRAGLEKNNHFIVFLWFLEICHNICERFVGNLFDFFLLVFLSSDPDPKGAWCRLGSETLIRIHPASHNSWELMRLTLNLVLFYPNLPQVGSR